jgi:prolyl oligopeptidase
MRLHLQTCFLLIGSLCFFNSSDELQAADAAVGEQFERLLADAWEYRLREEPLFATSTGDHRYDDKLPSVSLADEKRREATRREFVARLEDIDRAALSADDQTNYDIFSRLLRDNGREYEFQTYLMPISDRWGFHVDFPELPRDMALLTGRDYENYIARLNGFAEYAAGHIELMREGVKRGVTVPSVIMQRYNEPLEAQIVDDP